MRILLAAGSFHGLLQPCIPNIINANPLTCESVTGFVNEGITSPDLLIYTDSGLGNSLQRTSEKIRETIQALAQNGFNTKILLVTSNSEILSLGLPPQVEVKFFFGGRVSFEDFRRIVQEKELEAPPTPSVNEQKKDTWINKLFVNHEQAQEESSSSSISRGISRVVAVTGDRGSGVTSTVMNLAESAVKEGLSVIVVDLDIILRGVNMYCSSATTSEDENLKNSLIRLLAKPHNCDMCTYKAKPGLHISTLPYSFVESQLLEKFFTAEKIITLIAILKNKFNLCILDLPFEIASQYSAVLSQVDTFALCVKNTLHSVFNTVRNLDVRFSSEARKMIIAKSKIVVTEYNDKIVYRGSNFTPNKVSELLKIVSNEFETVSDPIGYIPYDDDFNKQIETEISAVNEKVNMKESYKKILVKILEGVV